MAPSAVGTLYQHFQDTRRTPQDYDLILTGDLGVIGKKIANELMLSREIDMQSNYQDCGCLIFDGEKQDTHAVSIET